MSEQEKTNQAEQAPTEKLSLDNLDGTAGGILVDGFDDLRINDEATAAVRVGRID